MISAAISFVMTRTWARYALIGLALLAGLKARDALIIRRDRASQAAKQIRKNFQTYRRVVDAGNEVDTSRSAISQRLRDGRF